MNIIMDLVKWKPFNEIKKLRDEMDTLFSTNFPFSAFQSDFAVDVVEDDDVIIVKAELPGVDRENLSVDFQDGMLTIKAEKKEEKEDKGKFYRKESTYGMMSRSFRVPGGVDSDEIDAEYKDGILKVTMPRSEEDKVKKIDIK